ncbi:MAG: hypothetical protein WD646_12545 [Actinomycetota bacterium]
MRSRILALPVVLILAAPACTSNEPETAPSPTVAPSRNIAVELREFSVGPDPDVGAAGEVEFTVENTGEDIHEFVVISTDLDPGQLPTKTDGSVDEDQVDGVDEIEDIEPGDSQTLTLDLDPGPYALVCNRVDTEDGETEVHYKLGMRTAFTVR